MWAGIQRGHRFAAGENATEVVFDAIAENPRHARMHGYTDPTPVTVSVTEDGPYWGWLPAATELRPFPTPVMIYRRKVLFDVCFPYGPEADERAGQGRIVRLSDTGDPTR